MKLAKLLTFGLLWVTLSAHAASSGEHYSLMNINEGNWNAGGSASFSQTTGLNNNSSRFRLSPHLEYFMITGFSLGGNFALDKPSSGNSTATLGPTASYYFYAKDKMAAFFSASLDLGLTSATVDSILGLTIGLRNFLTQSVAIGPSIEYDIINSNSFSYGAIRFAVGFDIYL